ncbi:hypothetical protein C8J57DRAFT_1730475 [Mycena rebaudengoi]|nr:hypothetical protein C8J57DRAFT_1730475 [Mycena rebaudengoi]
MPALHLLAMWALITYFVVFREPLAAAGGGMGVVGKGVGVAWRWHQLASRRPQASGWSVQLAPFFWGFVTLELLFSGLDTLQPPTLLALALPHLPPPIPPSS